MIQRGLRWWLQCLCTCFIDEIPSSKQNDQQRLHVCFFKTFVTQEFLHENNFEVVSHASYSPDLAPSNMIHRFIIAPSNFWLFPMIKDALCGCLFSSWTVFVSVIFHWSQKTTKEVFVAAMEAWHQHCESVFVHLHGDLLRSDKSFNFLGSVV